MELIIDTSDQTYIALKNCRGIIIDHFEGDLRFNQSEQLLQIVEGLLSKNGLSKNELSSINVNNGPGSYTGIRIGLTTANFLAFGLNIPVFSGINNFLLKSRFSSPVLAVYANKPCITEEKPRLK
jgi:tRNA threonylcarbamoyladenosine biosynthesis protein TsaB